VSELRRQSPETYMVTFNNLALSQVNQIYGSVFTAADNRLYHYRLQIQNETSNSL